ncbi:hypothetical protein EAG18_08300 [Pseudoalteromonas sp. J010]|uniref:hypothetical protein n=1 Tax=Pseudoalteromonas sp. J010 TaxID=998465 RepID=UPI000F6471D1|nr:hypothetical protein [Pseudoalteromonas sp. J010]RRS09111.1 hypothetical protein EAG18_08300 [Pseudoalteromonas sp. J010]
MTELYYNDHQNLGLKSPNGPSARLNEMLDKNKKRWKEPGHGRTSVVRDAADISFSAAAKWLKEDVLPRKAEDRVHFAQILQVDLLYWEYGERRKVERKPVDILKFSVVTHQMMSKLGLSHNEIKTEQLILIQEIALAFSDRCGDTYPDEHIIERLFKLAIGKN